MVKFKNTKKSVNGVNLERPVRFSPGEICRLNDGCKPARFAKMKHSMSVRTQSVRFRQIFR